MKRVQIDVPNENIAAFCHRNRIRKPAFLRRHFRERVLDEAEVAVARKLAEIVHRPLVPGRPHEQR